jgi:hypothetical protein
MQNENPYLDAKCKGKMKKQSMNKSAKPKCKWKKTNVKSE